MSLVSPWTVACQPSPSPEESSQPRDQTWVSCIAGGFFTDWATREAPGPKDFISKRKTWGVETLSHHLRVSYMENSRTQLRTQEAAPWAASPPVQHRLPWKLEPLDWTGAREVVFLLVNSCIPSGLPTMTIAAKSLQSCPTLCDPRDGSPPGSPIPGILQARTLEWVAISFSNAWKWKMKVKSLSRVRPFMIPWTATCQAPPSMGFSRQEYWSGVPLPSPNNDH